MLSTRDLHGATPDEYMSCRLLWLVSFVLLLPYEITRRAFNWVRRKPYDSVADGASVFRTADSLAKLVVGTAYSAK